MFSKEAVVAAQCTPFFLVQQLLVLWFPHHKAMGWKIACLHSKAFLFFYFICLFPTSTMATGLCLSCDNPWHLILFVFCLCMCVCVSASRMCYIWNPSAMLFLFVRACHWTTSSTPKKKKKKVKKAVLHNLRYDYCSVDGVAYVNMHSCRIQRCHFLARLQLLLLLGVDLNVHLFFLCFGIWVPTPQWPSGYTHRTMRTVAATGCFLGIAVFGQNTKKKKKIGIPESTNKAKQQSSLAGSLPLPLFNIFPKFAVQYA